MFVDEFYFHQKRGLPLWERIGHPLDTLSTVMVLSIPVFYSLNADSLKVYLAVAIFSCLFITKDEFIHRDHCCKAELWLHALLFILHPLTFLGTYLIWRDFNNHIFFKFQLALTLGFMLYQIMKWSIPWKHLRE